MSEKIVILGGGYAGVTAALKLHKKKKSQDNIEITLIDKNHFHTLMTELHEVSGNRVSEDSVAVPLREIFEYTDVKLIRDTITNIDFDSKKLSSKDSDYYYDYLIISAGSQPNYYGIPGMEEYSFPLWSYEDSIKIREHIHSCFIKASQSNNTQERNKLLTFVIGGAGFTGVELVGELALWFKTLSKTYKINRNEVNLTLVEAMPSILTMLDDKNINKSMNYLKNKLKVNVLLNSPIISVDKETVILKSGEEIKSASIIWTAGIKAAEIGANICTVENKNCRIIVDKYMKTSYKDVYSIGDISAFNNQKGFLPSIVEAAVQGAEICAKNILAEIRKESLTELKPKIHGFMVSIGSYFAVSEIMGKRLPVLLSIMMKYLVNIHYLFEIGGFDLVIKYLKHEFLNKRQEKHNTLENHLTNVSMNVWLVPLRLFLGGFWLMEGITKIKTDWLTKEILSGRAPDASSSASVTEYGEQVFRIVAEHTPLWYEWIVDSFIVPNALLFQCMLVFTEIAIGLSLITGTFTFIFALVSLGMTANFIISTGMYPETWWVIPAAIAMLAGSGRSFGLDKYVIPYIIRQFKYFMRNKKLKFFI